MDNEWPFSAISEIFAIIEPIYEVSFWGILTTLAYFYALFNWLNSPYNDKPTDVYHPVTAGVLGLIWTINTGSWLTSLTHWMLITDSLYLVIVAYIHFLARERWTLFLCGLSTLPILLDVQYWRGMGYDWYSNLSNCVYFCQLITVSGFAERNRRTSVID